MGEFDGLVAIITGGGGTIGPAYGRALASEGARIVLADVRLDAAERAAAALRTDGLDVRAVQVDVTDPASVAAAVAGVVADLGRIDILINNAGYAVTVDWPEVSSDEWRRTLDVNLTGCFLMSQAVTPVMRNRGWGKIVSLTSSVSWLGPANLVHYVAAKSGVIGFTRALARAVGPWGITVNAIAPGLTVSEPILKLYSRESLDLHASRRALKRYAYPEDLVGTVVFLCSHDSDFMTGQTIVVDGGQVFH